MKPFTLNFRQGRAFWQVDILWVVLAEGNETDNQFSLLWELCPRDAGPPPHYHDQDEGFYVLDGQVTYLTGGQQLVATSGDFVWIPRGTIHSFRVDMPTATLLNCYTPAGFEQTIIQQGTPAAHLELPPPDLPTTATPGAMRALFQQIGMHPVSGPDVLRAVAPST